MPDKTLVVAMVESRPATTPTCEGGEAMTYLMLDSRNIESAENARLTVGTVKKHPANPLFREDRPWEPRFDNLYANVIYDVEEQKYKCWYSPFVIDMTHQATTSAERNSRSMNDVGKQLRKEGLYRREMGVCYATSRDGLKWEKPNLDIYPWSGEKSNVLVFGPHGAGVFKDPCDPDPNRRYKMIAKIEDGEEKPLGVAFSEDGLHLASHASGADRCQGRHPQRCTLGPRAEPLRRLYSTVARQRKSGVSHRK